MKATINTKGDVTLVIDAAEVVAFRQGMLTASSPASYGNAAHAWQDVIAAHTEAYNLVSHLVTPAPAPRTFATKAERAAGKGFACAATPACSRTDFTTALRASLHATTQAELAVFGHAADKAPLPK